MSNVSPIDPLAQSLQPFDPIDLAATAGCLQLMPENAGRYLVLPALAHAIATLQPSDNKPRISAGHLRGLFRVEPLGKGFLTAAEDPFEFSFTESIAFKEGTYIVFPGNGSESSTFVLRHIFQAIDTNENSRYGRFCEKAQSLSRAALLIINAVARRAQLTYGLEPTSEFRESVLVPKASILSNLKKAVIFSKSEITTLLENVGLDLSAIERLVLPFGTITSDSYRLGDGPAAARPILVSGDVHIVVNPQNVLSALRHQIVCLATESGVRKELASQYHKMIWQTVVDTFDFMRHELELYVDDASGPPWLSEGLFAFDSDKTAYVALITDPLDDYDADEVFGYWSAAGVQEAMDARLTSIQHHVLTSPNAPNEILSVFLSAGFGRVVMVGSSGGDIAVDAPLVGLSASDLETIAQIESGEGLALWKFAKAAHSVRKNTSIAPTTMLNEYSYYRSNHYSYYLSDDATPNMIVLGEGGAGRLRRELVPKRNWHAVESYKPKESVEVGTMHDTVSFPIYGPRSILRGDYEVVIEGLPLPIWIVSTDTERGTTAYAVAVNFTDLIAYWLWQFTPSLAQFLNPLVNRYPHVVIRLNIAPNDAWFRRASITSDLPVQLVATCNVDEGFLNLEPEPSILSQLNSANNAGEREFMRTVLGYVAQLAIGSSRPLTDEAISAVIETHAPLGLKKKMLMLIPESEPPLDPGQLPSARKVQPTEESELLDQLGRHLRSEIKLPVGKIADNERTAVLGQVVDFYYGQLQRLVASLNPIELLERLIAQHEAIVHSTAMHKLQMPTRLAAFDSVPEILEIVRKEIPDDTNAALASRFVIEYVEAQPPSGLRPLSMDVYDRLQAIANHLVNFGFESDLIFFNLADLKLSVLPSGRLNVDRDLFMKASAQHLDAFSAGRFARSARRFAHDFEEMMTRGTREPSEKPDWAVRIDAAAVAEFGYALTDLGKVMMQAVRIGQDSESKFLTSDLEDFHSLIAGNLDFPTEKVAAIVEMLSLEERPDFLTPPPPNSKWSVLPWRFNRSYSYVRRPFLLRRSGTETTVLWGFRHVYDSWINLLSLTLNGRLECRSPEMRKLMGEANDESGEVFNQLVAEQLAKNERLIIDKKVKRFGNCRVPPEFGDFDVLVIDARRRRLIPIECKDLSAARTAHDMANEIGSLFHGHGHKKSYVAKHERRVAWLKANIDQVLRSYGIESSKRWKIEALLAVSQVLVTPYLHNSPMLVISYEELMKEGDEWG